MKVSLEIGNLINDEQCYEQVRRLRWPKKITCPHCQSEAIIKRGKDESELHRQRYECHGCHKRFDDLTNTVFSGHHQPLIASTVALGSLIYTDEYNIYHRLTEWGYEHKTVNRSIGEYARDEDDDGFHEVHVNTMEGFWSLLRSWLRPHRGISQEKLPIYLGFFEYMHNVRKRGKAVLNSLVQLLIS